MHCCGIFIRMKVRKKDLQRREIGALEDPSDFSALALLQACVFPGKKAHNYSVLRSTRSVIQVMKCDFKRDGVFLTQGRSCQGSSWRGVWSTGSSTCLIRLLAATKLRKTPRVLKAASRVQKTVRTQRWRQEQRKCRSPSLAGNSNQRHNYESFRPTWPLYLPPLLSLSSDSF